MVGRFVSLLKKSESAKDPVCGMMVDMKKPGGGTHEHQGKTYYFCGPGCKVAFSKDPEGYLSGKKQMKM